MRFWARPIGIPALTLIVHSGRLVVQGELLALYRHERPSEQYGERDWARSAWQGAHARVAEYGKKTYLLKEMGFHIARKHRLRLRLIARLTAFVVPLIATLATLVAASTLAAAIAVLSAALGLVAERWLFFAEAKHTVMLYYGAEAV